MILDKTGISLIHPYYNDASRLALQLKIWAAWSPRVCENVDITLVDDGSPEEPLTLTNDDKKMFNDKGIRISTYRILTDLKWNTPGALNLGVAVAPRPMVLFMDTDCFLESPAWEKLLGMDLSIEKFWKFPRYRLGDPLIEETALVRYLPCSMLVHKNLFMRLGGFDEDFTGANNGGYGFFDNELDSRANAIGAHHSKYNVVQEVAAGEWMPSVSGRPTVRPHRDSPPNKKLMRAKQKGEIPQNRQILNFPWKQEYTNWSATPCTPCRRS